MHLYDDILHLNQSEACAMLGCSIATLKRVHMRDVDFPNAIFPTGRRALWRLDELKAYAEARVQRSRSQTTLSITAGADPNASIERRKDNSA